MGEHLSRRDVDRVERAKGVRADRRFGGGEDLSAWSFRRT
jgi:hypothetical protein